MRQIILLIVLTCSLYSSAQDSNLILNSGQHYDWFAQVDSSDLSIKAELIRERIISDTCVFIMEYFPDGITLESFPELIEIRKKRELGFLKPSYLFSFKGQYRLVTFENLTNNQSAEKIANLITTDNIQKIQAEYNETKLAVYGRQGAGGIVFLSLKTRNAWKIIKKVELVDHYGFVIK